MGQTVTGLSIGHYPSRIGLDCAPMEDGGDVLGNLPRTRPGRRSEKRAGTIRDIACFEIEGGER